MKQRSGITIVIPVFNREQVVGKTLASVEAQTLRPLSVVLVDNASTDGSRRVLEEWAMRPHGIDVKGVDESTRIHLWPLHQLLPPGSFLFGFL